MIVPKMNSEELVREIQQDIEIVDRKAYYLASKLRREAIKSKTKHAQRVFDYTSKRLNKWIITVDHSVSRASCTATVYFINIL